MVRDEVQMLEVHVLQQPHIETVIASCRIEGLKTFHVRKSNEVVVRKHVWRILEEADSLSCHSSIQSAYLACAGIDIRHCFSVEADGKFSP